MRSLTLYIPGLLGPDVSVGKDDLPSLPALNWLLGRSEQQGLRLKPPSDQLCELFGLEKNADADYPVAAISRLSDDNQPPEGFWLRADPVHVMADRDGLILLDQTRFRLSQHDALALAAEVNQVLAPRGMQLEVPVPYRWYIRLDEPQHLVTTPLELVVGKDVLPFMPSGDDRIAWIQLLNEIQMALHAAEINQQREQNNQLPINSLWFWGTGVLPDRIERHWSLVISDDMLARGLAMVASTPFQEMPASFNRMQESQSRFNTLIAFQGLQRFNYYHDMEGWLEALLELEENWFQPLKRTLQAKQIDQLVIRVDSMLFKLDSKARYRFWKPKQDLLAVKAKIKN